MVEQLARYTFIIMAIEHFGEGLSTHFPGGSPLNLDRRIDWSEMNAKLENPQLSVEEIKQIIFESWKTREDFIFLVVLDETGFVLNKLSELDRIFSSGNPFTNRLDLNRIGALGWSQSRAASMNILVHDS